MKNLILTLAVLVLTFVGIRVNAEPVTEVYRDVHGFRTSNVWKKFIGQSVPDGTPDIIDYSYAGYQNGREEIPEASGRIVDVTDFGAVPNDNRSDTQAIRDALEEASSGNAIVFFPRGKYDVLMPGDNMDKFVVEGDNIIVKGSGAKGSDSNGTTIKQHGKVSGPDGAHFSVLFKTEWHHNGHDQGPITRILGSQPRGSTFIDVESTVDIDGTGFIEIKAYNLYGDDWDTHSSVSLNNMPSEWTVIREEGVTVKELNEIDYIDGNRIHLKSPILSNVNSAYVVSWAELSVGIGCEDLHFDSGLDQDYMHNWDIATAGRGAFAIQQTAHSWIRRCRLSNVVLGAIVGESYCGTIHSIIVDGNFGHYPVIMGGSTYSFIGLVEDRSNKGMHHGISVSEKSVGAVCWVIGGYNMKGPDTHGNMPRHNLFDNYYGNNHHSNGGQERNLPHHLDGQVRWNNSGYSSYDFNGKSITKLILIGYKTHPGKSYKNVYAESFGQHVNPKSLFVAQLNRRNDTVNWTDAIISDYRDFFNSIYNGNSNMPPIFGVYDTIYVDDGTPANTDFGSPITARDANGDTITYRVSGGAREKFGINATTAQLKTLVDIDFTDGEIYKLLIESRDEHAHIDDLWITIQVTDINFPPKLTGSTTRTVDIDENNEVNANVGDPIIASDPDGDSLTYTLRGTDAGSFSVDSQAMQLKAGIRFDYETKSKYSVTVRISDGDEYVDVAFTVNVEDINDAPEFEAENSIHRSIAENTEPGTNIGEPLTATDVEGDNITYLLGRVDQRYFAIDSNTGQLKTKARLDYEVKSVYEIVAIAYSNLTSSNLYITVNVIDIDESVIRETMTRSIAENTESGINIGEPVTTTSVESNGALYLLAAADQKYFTLGRRTAQLKTKKSLDYENRSVYVITVIAINGPIFYIDVTINVLDVAESIISDRTPQVRDAIVARLPNRDTEFDVTEADLLKIKRLYLYDKGLRRLKIGDFYGLTNLTEIDLSDNRISTLSSRIFSENTKLKRIILNNNELTSLNEGIFDSCPKLKEVYLADNRLTFIGEVFTGMESIEIIQLRNQEKNGRKTLTFLHPNSLSGLENLERLNLSDNGNIRIPIYIDKVGNNGIKLHVSTGMPFDAKIPILVDGVQVDKVKIDVGHKNSSTIRIDGDAGESVDVTIGTLPSLPKYHSGYTFRRGSSRKTITFPDVPAAPNLPVSTQLLDNFPNPFNPETWIPYQLAQKSFVNITIYNSRGVVVRQLPLGIQPAGFYRNKERAVYWDGKNSFGEQVATGIYFYQLNAGSLSVLKKMVLLK